MVGGSPLPLRKVHPQGYFIVGLCVDKLFLHGLASCSYAKSECLVPHVCPSIGNVHPRLQDIALCDMPSNGIGMVSIDMSYNQSSLDTYVLQLDPHFFHFPPPNFPLLAHLSPAISLLSHFNLQDH
ncbi:hypothetical protein L6452_18851 [Arctium lappa]|uniref:Uncharacterized protein n=1 Tax=Arctium lappa TaxID=4217 RepID=A0ACB9C7B9_ARCLA|nr:hypothetical protein L6452_18851 [Arctium lappa]